MVEEELILVAGQNPRESNTRFEFRQLYASSIYPKSIDGSWIIKERLTTLNLGAKE